MAKTIYVQLTENKAIKNYSTNQQDGYTAATIQDADAYSLAEYYNLMWVDDGNLVHAENTPATEYQKEINQTKADIANAQQQVSADIQALQTKVDQANQASTALDAKIQAATLATNKMIGQVQFQLTRELATIQSSQATSSSASK